MMGRYARRRITMLADCDGDLFVRHKLSSFEVGRRRRIVAQKTMRSAMPVGVLVIMKRRATGRRWAPFCAKPSLRALILGIPLSAQPLRWRELSCPQKSVIDLRKKKSRSAPVTRRGSAAA